MATAAMKTGSKTAIKTGFSMSKAQTKSVKEDTLYTREAVLAKNNAIVALSEHTPDAEFTIDDLKARVKAMRAKK